MERLFTSFDSAFELLSKHKFPKNSKNEIKMQMKSNIEFLYKKIMSIEKNNNPVLYNCLSCIYGEFLGDAIGAYCEFDYPNVDNIKKIYNGNPRFGDDKGQVTDDSEMAMCLGFGIMDSNSLKDIDQDIIFKYYGAWAKSKPNDIGQTTRKALNEFKFDYFSNNQNLNEVFQKIKQSNYNSKANGFLMRISPFVVWCNFAFKDTIKNVFLKKEKIISLYKLIKIQAEKDCNCTHPNPFLPTVSSCFCLLTLGAINNLKPTELLNDLKELIDDKYFDENQNEKEIKNIILNELSIYKNNSSNFNDFNYFTIGEKSVVQNIGYCIHAFRLTLFFIYFFDNLKQSLKFTKFRNIMNKICTYGGDTDTNAAIVGTVIGPLIGYKAFGEEEFSQMFKLIPQKRSIFVPALMVNYINFLQELESNKLNDNKLPFLKMYLEFCYLPFDGNLVKFKRNDNENLCCSII
jgi:ADP-ribosylglycohydrolase